MLKQTNALFSQNGYLLKVPSENRPIDRIHFKQLMTNRISILCFNRCYPIIVVPHSQTCLKQPGIMQLLQPMLNFPQVWATEQIVSQANIFFLIFPKQSSRASDHLREQNLIYSCIKRPSESLPSIKYMSSPTFAKQDT